MALPASAATTIPPCTSKYLLSLCIHRCDSKNLRRRLRQEPFTIAVLLIVHFFVEHCLVVNIVHHKSTFSRLLFEICLHPIQKKRRADFYRLSLNSRFSHLSSTPLEQQNGCFGEIIRRLAANQRHRFLPPASCRAVPIA